MNDNVNIGVINGGNNNINQNNHFHQHNHNNGGGEKGRGKSDDPAGAAGVAALSVVVVTAVVAVNYLIHREIIFFWLMIALMTGVALHASAVFSQAFDRDWNHADLVGPLVGVGIAILLLVLTVAVRDALPEQALVIAAGQTSAKGIVPRSVEIWLRFSPEGQRIVLSNLAGVLCLAVGLCANAAFGFQQLLESNARAAQSTLLMRLAGKLNLLKTWGVGLCIAMLVGACIALYVQ